jgi:hypothetical protein
MAGRRREQRPINSAKLRPRHLATENLKLVAQDQQLEVLDVQATATADERSEQGPERDVEEREGHPAILPALAQTSRDTTIGALQVARGPLLDVWARFQSAAGVQAVAN